MNLKLQTKLKDCSSKFRSKHSTNIVLCLLRNLLEQSLKGFHALSFCAGPNFLSQSKNIIAISASSKTMFMTCQIFEKNKQQDYSFYNVCTQNVLSILK